MKEPITKRLAKGSAIIFFYTVGASLLGYILRILLSRTLSIEMFGLFYSVSAVFVLLSGFSDLGFGDAFVYYASKYLKRKDLKRVWLIYNYYQFIFVGFSLLVSAMLIFLAPWLSKHFFKYPEAKLLIYILALYFLANSFFMSVQKIFISQQKTKIFSSFQFSQLLFAVLFSILFLLGGKGNIYFYSIAWSGSFIACALFYNIIFYRRDKNLVHSFEWNKKNFNTLLKYAIPNLSATLLFIFITYTDTIYITLLRGIKEVGIYNVVLPIASISSIILMPINTLIFPLVSHFMEGEKEEVQKIIQSALIFLPFISFYFAIFLILFPSYSISLMFGQKWLGLTESPLIFFSLSYIPAVLSNFLLVVAIGMGLVNERLKNLSIIGVTKLVLTFILVKNFGVLGAAFANLGVFLLSTILYAKMVRKIVSFSFPLIYYFKLSILGISLFLFVTIFEIKPQSLLQFLLFGVIYTILIIIFGLYLRLLNKNFLSMFLSKKTL